MTVNGELLEHVLESIKSQYDLRQVIPYLLNAPVIPHLLNATVIPHLLNASVIPHLMRNYLSRSIDRTNLSSFLINLIAKALKIKPRIGKTAPTILGAKSPSLNSV